MTRDELVERMARAIYPSAWEPGPEFNSHARRWAREMATRGGDAALTELEKHAVVTQRKHPRPKLIWEVIGTGELKDGAVPFLPPTQAVWAVYEAGAWRKLSPHEAALAEVRERHFSDCAIHDAPAYAPGECTCAAARPR